uniref:Uncharacterized protein n=1 Tax=viral metagenome TaxID=1070528 RepID=A0A6M3LE73_9ZZZZ
MFKKLVIVFVLFLFIFSCASPLIVEEVIREKYNNALIFKLDGSSDKYIILTENSDVRFIDMHMFLGRASIDVDQDLYFVVKEYCNKGK